MSSRAFSLIELLVVVGIIAILSSLLLVLVTHMRDSARSTVCAGQVRQVALGAIAMAQDARGVLPWSDPFDRNGMVWPRCVAGDTMFNMRDDYDVPLQTWRCPGDALFSSATDLYIVDSDNTRITEAQAQTVPWRGRVCMSYQYFGPYVSGPFSWEVRNLRQADARHVLLSDFTMIEGGNVYANHRRNGRSATNHAFADGSVLSLGIDDQDQYFTNGPYRFYSRLMRD